MLPSLSIAAPAYNEGENIHALVAEWARYLQTRFQPGDYEIVICDDGSRDNTGAALEELAREFPAVLPCHHATNQGAAAALSTAIRQTTKEWVLLLDSDGQFPIENLEVLASAWERGAGVAFIGYRRRKADSAFARLGSWASGGVCNLFHGTRYRDFNCALKLVEGDLLRSLCLEGRGLNYSTEISSKILERGVEMREIEVTHRARARGRSTRTLWRGSLERLLFVAYIGWRQLFLKLGILRRQKYSA